MYMCMYIYIYIYMYYVFTLKFTPVALSIIVYYCDQRTVLRHDSVNLFKVITEVINTSV